MIYDKSMILYIIELWVILYSNKSLIDKMKTKTFNLIINKLFKYIILIN